MNRLAYGFLLILLGAGAAPGQNDAGNLSLRLETEYHLEGGLNWLRARQKQNGAFGDGNRPELTALAMLALIGDPERPQDPVDVANAGAYLRGLQRADGSIDADVFATSLALLAWLGCGDAEKHPAPRLARAYLISQQKPDGSFGDMRQTMAALEALYFAHSMLKAPPEKDAGWTAAKEFLRARPVTGDGLTESAGLLASFYAGTLPGDARNQAALDWLGANFTPEKITGVTPEDLTFCQYVIAKGLIAYRVTDLPGLNWRESLTLYLHRRHTLNGPWKTPEGVDPLETSVLAMLTLEAIARQL